MGIACSGVLSAGDSTHVHVPFPDKRALIFQPIPFPCAQGTEKNGHVGMSTLKGLGQSEGHMGQYPVPLTIPKLFSMDSSAFPLPSTETGRKIANLSGFLTTLALPQLFCRCCLSH